MPKAREHARPYPDERRLRRSAAGRDPRGFRGSVLRLLLDTHALIWALATPGKLPKELRTELAGGEHEVFASAASTWEIAIKSAIGKIDADLDEIIEASAATGFEELPIRRIHTARVGDLPSFHQDPFDRLLIAQALEEGLTLVTRDPVFGDYRVPTLWR
ncbi:MAG: type II toxin-antitoxin system VapC family toxin [Actinomycetota bacterium]